MEYSEEQKISQNIPLISLENILLDGDNITLMPILKLRGNPAGNILNNSHNRVRYYLIATNDNSYFNNKIINNIKNLKTNIAFKEPFKDSVRVLTHDANINEKVLEKRPYYSQRPLGANCFSLYRVGFKNIQNLQSYRNILVGAMFLPPEIPSRPRFKKLYLNSTSNYAIAIKHNGRIYPQGAKQENTNKRTLNKLIDTSNYLIGRNQSVEKTDNTLLEQTNFSNLFTAVEGDSLKLGFFVNKNRLIENKFQIFSQLSETTQQNFIDNSTIIDFTLNQKRVQKSINNTTSLYDHEAERIENISEESRSIGNLLSGLGFYSAAHPIRTFSPGVSYQYEVSFKLKNSIQTYFNKLIDNISILDQFEACMSGVFMNPILYSTSHEHFILEKQNLLKRIILNEFENVSSSRDIGEYFVKLFSEIVESFSYFNKNSKLSSIPANELLKLISFNFTEFNTNKRTFDIFFKAFTEVKTIVNKILVKYSIFFNNSNSSKKPKISFNLDNNIIQIRHQFNYVFTPSNYSLMSSYIPSAAFSNPESNFSELPFKALKENLDQNIKKYFREDSFPPVINPNLNNQEKSQDKLNININIDNYFSINSIKNSTKVIADLSKNYEWDPKQFLDFALIISYFKTFSAFPASRGKDIDENLNIQLDEIFNYLNLYKFNNKSSFDFKDIVKSQELFGKSLPCEDKNKPTQKEKDEEKDREIQKKKITIIESMLFEILDNYMQNPESYKKQKSNIDLRTESILRSAFLDRAPIDGLPYQLYALYENVSPALSEETVQTTFYWGGKAVLENPINMSTIRLNFTNIKAIEVFAGFGTLADGSLNLKKPLFVPLNIRNTKQNIPNSILCRFKDYSFNSPEIPYLGNDSIIRLKNENNYFLLTN